MEEILERIKKRFPDTEIPEDEVKERLRLLLYEFKVPPTEAEKTIVNYLMKTYHIEPQVPVTEAKQITVEQIPATFNEGTKYVTLEVKVAKLWEPTKDTIAQTGLIGDPTGIVRFVLWKNADQPTLLEENKTYRLENVVIDKYGDRYSILITRYSKITELDKDIKLPERTVKFTAPIIAILSGSGLIARCPLCNKIVKGNVCSDHGKVTPKDDLRVKAVFDDGSNVYYVILNEENIKKLTGIGLNEAIEIARQTFERSTVLTELSKLLLCKYFTVEGRKVGNYVLVESINPAKPNVDEIKEVIV